jgi:hypothetical protein
MDSQHITKYTITGHQCLCATKDNHSRVYVQKSTIICKSHVSLDQQNDIRAVFGARLLATNNCRFGLQRHLQYRLLSTKTKIMLHKTLTRLVILYGCETRTILKAEEKRIKVLERRIFEKHLYSEGGRTVLVDEI